MAEVEKFYLWSNEHVARMPLSTCVLSCHGLSDTTVPPYNAAMFANRIPNHTLSLIEGADHNFRGKFEELTVVVLDFFQKHEHNQYQRAISMGQGSGLIIPRWIDVDGVRNFRDIGGWPTKDKAGYIRERVVFRSANLANATPDGIERLIKLNVKAIFDFRYDREVEKNGILREIPGVSHFAYNMFEEGLKTPEDAKAHLMEYLKGEEGFANSYMFIVETNKKLIGNIFRYMSKELSPKDRSAMVVHCSAGKDRTGVFIMLLLGLCGVDDEIIAREYDLTSLGYFGFEKDLEKRAENMGLTVENLRAALSASVGGMRLCIQQLRKKYGSFEDYVRDKCGLTNEEVNLIRELMIVPIRFEERQLHRPRM
ncbi:protein-tyrosine phosphatase-like protein [Mycotypha africana]|uniref:protein-tyrosine phosphatase-like protein n=1 Tax=Mycotypha africana TaxID=64632 RepID=UPI00230188AC|nr:protein-tyrosine phosphatase-like protein [Mycotypha africana]KAI8984742.1 protein-tyrosine phosphatase-like protein [Mycotypha africana]